jgi:hypothetical protein
MNTRLHRCVLISATVVALAGSLLATAAPARALPLDPLVRLGKADLVIVNGGVRWQSYLVQDSPTIAHWAPPAPFVWAIVSNVGNAYASPSYTRAAIGFFNSQGVYVTETYILAVPTLAPGTSATVQVFFSGNGCILSFSGAADCFYGVNESNEGNNGLAYTLAGCIPSDPYL